MTATTEPIQAPPGLKNVIVTDTTVGDVRGAEGFFHYRGYDATQLARTSSFERVWYLMHTGVLPDPDSPQLAAFTSEVAAERALPDEIWQMLPALVRPGSNPLHVLRTVIALIGDREHLGPVYDSPLEASAATGRRLAAMVPTVVAAAYRLSRGLDPLRPDASLDHTTDYLRMVTGRDPQPKDRSAIEHYLIATIDHGFNASTFTARVVASTASDLASCLLGAIGAFLGPLHGGAPDRALQALDEIGDPANTQAWVRQQIESNAKIMGFGHAVYRTHDPRAQMLKSLAIAYDDALVQQAIDVEQAIETTLAELKPGHQLYANVEFYAGVLMKLASIEAAMFTPTFCVARVVGWMANIIEQAQQGKIIRPIARYTGPMHGGTAVH